MRRPALWIGLAAFVLVSGTIWAVWRADIELPLRTRSLPGFDVGVPFGTSHGEEKNYRKGRLSVSGIAGLIPSVDVRWEAGGLYGDDQVALAIKAVGVFSGKEPVPIPITSEIATPGNTRTRSWALRLGDRTSWTTQIACGARRVSLTTGGSGNMERLHRRVAGSFRCRPDAARERTVGQIPVVFDVGTGWRREPSSDGDIRITNGRFVLVARLLDSAVVTEDFRKFADAAMPGFKFGDRVGDDWSFLLNVDGEQLHGWLTARTCSDGGQLLLMSLAEAGGEEHARALLARARCRRPDETPQIWPELPPEVDPE